MTEPLTPEELIEAGRITGYDLEKMIGAKAQNLFRGLFATIATLTAERDELQLEIARLTGTGVRADERREMQKAVAEAFAAEMGAETLRAALRRIRTRHAVIDGQFDRSTVSEIDKALGGKP